MSEVNIQNTHFTLILMKSQEVETIPLIRKKTPLLEVLQGSTKILSIFRVLIYFQRTSLIDACVLSVLLFL
jgi:hypothetical protein